MPNTSPFRHIVLFKFKDSASISDVEAVEKAFAGLPSKIDTIIDFEWGPSLRKHRGTQRWFHSLFLRNIQ
jgi:hypothetical protein